MEFTVRDTKTYAATGGKDFDNNLETVIFLHGTGLDHRCWALQTRWFAYNGYSVLALDFPGHSLSDGNPLTSIEDTGNWLIEALDATGVKKANVVGHSQGFLSALELTRQAPDRVTSLIGIGTAAAIPVNPALIEAAQRSSAEAANMLIQWGFGQKAHMGISAVPGMQPIAIGRQIMSDNPVEADLRACASYTSGEQAASEISVPCHLILADQDKLTPLKAGLAVAKQLNANHTIIDGYGHMLPIEAPKQCLQALRKIITS
ncbi:MAG: pimeloyl-ACP methyl ester carboxylesterase [Gammaproteobacteria bacterium]|jgi:pimeloyl-ACP methyl ester carboxylesterase